MTAVSEIVWGSTADDQINRGDSIDRNIFVKDPSDPTEPLKLGGHSVRIYASDPPSIKENATLTIEDADAGKLAFSQDSPSGELLRDGKTNWFKYAIDYSNGRVDVRKIWIEIS